MCSSSLPEQKYHPPYPIFTGGPSPLKCTLSNMTEADASYAAELVSMRTGLLFLSLKTKTTTCRFLNAWIMPMMVQTMPQSLPTTHVRQVTSYL